MVADDVHQHPEVGGHVLHLLVIQMIIVKIDQSGELTDILRLPATLHEGRRYEDGDFLLLAYALAVHLSEHLQILVCLDLREDVAERHCLRVGRQEIIESCDFFQNGFA